MIREPSLSSYLKLWRTYRYAMQAPIKIYSSNCIILNTWPHTIPTACQIQSKHIYFSEVLNLSTISETQMSEFKYSNVHSHHTFDQRTQTCIHFKHLKFHKHKPDISNIPYTYTVIYNFKLHMHNCTRRMYMSFYDCCDWTL